MVKGHERKSYQPSSSAKAAQLLASSGPKGGFGFGGWVKCTIISHCTIIVSRVRRLQLPGSHTKCCMLYCTCRFSGATPIAGPSPAASAPVDTEASGNAAAPALSGELDSEITQLLKSLSKRDATTKFKALQACKPLVSLSHSCS